MYLTIDVEAKTESGITITVGKKVRYLGHTIGGMVKVFWNGREEIINPLCCKELR